MNIPLFERFKKVTSVTLIFAIVFGLMTPAALAATSLFSDSFGSSGTGTVAGWIEGNASDANLSTSEPRAGSPTTGHLRVRDGGYVEKTINTAGYENIKLKYYWRGDNDGDGASDNLRVYWKTTASGSYNLINTHQLNGNDFWSSQVTVSLPAGANNTSIDIRFLGDSNADTEEGRVDDVSVEGDVIIIADTTAPTLSLPSNITQEASSSAGNVVTFTATATDTSPANPVVTCIPASGSTFAIGTTIVNCSATDAATNTANGSFTVTIQDTTKPVITLNGGTVNLNVGDSYIEQGATATDIVDGDLTASIVIGGAVVNTAAPGAYIVTYNVTDAHGNSATTVSRTVNVSDVTAPVISGVPSDIVVEQVGNAAATVSYTNPTANDDIDGPVLVLCTPVSGSSFPYGLTAVLCNATDLASNVANASFNVTIQDTIAPAATSVSIISNNTNPVYAKEGDVVTVLFTTSEPVNMPTATIAGKTASVVNTSGNDYTATYTLTAAETQGPAAITIDFSDIVGNNATQVIATMDSSSVTIDTVSPTPFTIIRPSDNEIIEDATTNSEGICETGSTVVISSAALQTNPTTTTCIGGQFTTQITFIPTSIDTTFDLTFTQIDSAGNTSTDTINTIQYRTRVVGTGGSGPANTDFMNINTVNPPAPTPTNPTPTPTPEPQTPPAPTPETPTENPTPENNPTPTPETPANPETNPEETPAPTPAPTPTPTPTPATSGGTTGGTGGNPAPFNPADATLDIGGGVEPDAADDAVEEESFDPADATLDEGGGEPGQESSYTLLWILLGLLALLNTWWFFVAKNKKETQPYRN